MSERRYEIISNVCVLVAIASALLFPRVGHFDWLIGSIGCAAGVVAAATYFLNQRSASSTAHMQANSSLAKAEFLELPHHKSADVLDPVDDRKHVALVFPNEEKHAWSNAELSRTRILLYSYYAKRMREIQHVRQQSIAKLAPERARFVDEVVEIVNRLAPTCEFEITSEGRIKILPQRISGSALFKDVAPHKIFTKGRVN